MRLLYLLRLSDQRCSAKCALPRALLIDTCLVAASIRFAFDRKRHPRPMTTEPPVVPSYGVVRVVQQPSPRLKLFEVREGVLADSVASIVAAPLWAPRVSTAAKFLIHRVA